MADTNIKAVITAEDKASAVLKKFEQNVTSAGSSTVRFLGDTVKAAAIGATVAIGGLVATSIDLVKSFDQNQLATAQLNAVLTSTKGIAGVTSEAALDLANSLSKVTRFSDETVISTEDLLLTFTNISKTIFPQATTTVLDMATALGEDTKNAAIQLGKALQDPILGVTALRRVGVAFTDAQKEQIKTLVESGNLLGAQKVILKELQTEFGGSAVAAGQTFAGSIDRLKNRVEIFKEELGGAIVNGITPFVKSLANVVTSDKFNAFIDDLSKKIQEFITQLLNFATRVWPIVKKAWDEFISTLRDWIIPFLKDTRQKIIDLHEKFPLLLDIIGIVSAISVAFAINPFLTLTSAAIVGITFLHQHWKDITQTIKNDVDDVNKYVNEHPLLKDIFAWLNTQLGIIVKNFQDTFANLKQIFKDVSPELIVLAKVLGAALAAAFLVFVEVLTIVSDLLKEISDLFRKLAPLVTSVVKGLPILGPLEQLLGHRASGGPVMGGAPYIVGEQGPELFVPNSAGNIVPNNQIKQSNQTNINVVIQAQAFMGNQTEARKFAVLVGNHLKDVAGMKSMTVSDLLS